ncbi:hypothetical protein FJT64_006570 [Amphibalanus amphitrite]|uniref:G-protein coupled receptors family 1 profile domain-containing protein n=1 Tax=Amphibalanus amphitrite TaxID=1232801 RepID=A0A6A4VP51_AMPAM|nr:hypothetical protein FJT64_006570 [Amphibalanus amphitrite]
MYVFVKTAVGCLLTANYAVPLYTVVSNRHLWDEPMAVLAGNLSATVLLFGMTLTLIGAHDIVQLQVNYVCETLQYSSFGLAVSFKMSEVCVAVDQFVAVTRPLHHYALMTRARPWLLAAIWLPWAANVLFGVFGMSFQLERFAETALGSGNVSLAFPECRWERALATV